LLHHRKPMAAFAPISPNELAKWGKLAKANNIKVE
jgi:hypothetical protein